jgi:phage terminase small subunit
MKFAHELVTNEGRKTGAECAIAAGYSPDAAIVYASKLQNPRTYPLVVQYIGKLRDEYQKKYDVTFGRHISELAKLRDDARESKAWSAAVNAEVAQEVSRADRREFKMAFRSAITDARQAGKITVEDARDLRRASFSPAFVREAERLSVIQMVVSGENPELVPRDTDGKVNTAGINWDGLGKFLQLLLPLMLEFLKGLGL